MLSEGSSVKGSPEDKQASAPYIRGSAKISRRVTLARFTGTHLNKGLLGFDMRVCLEKIIKCWFITFWKKVWCTHFIGPGDKRGCNVLAESG